MKGKKKSLVLVGIVLILVIVVAATLKSKSSASEADSNAIYVSTAGVECMDLTATITTKGTVEAKESAKVYSETAGLVEDVLVKEGDSVTADQVIVLMDTEALDKQIRDAKIEWDIAQINYENAANEKSLDAAISGTKTAYDNASKSYEDAKKLFDSGALSSNELDTAKQTMDAMYDEYMEAVGDKANNSGRIKTMSLTAESAKNTYDDLLDKKEKASIKAPMAGTVTKVDVKKYDMTSVGTPIVVIETVDDLQISTYIGEYDINKVEVGMPVKITGYGVGDSEYEGIVSYVGSSAEVREAGQTTEKSVLVKIDFKDRTAFKPNFTADLDIVYATSEQATVVPYESILNMDKAQYVIKIEDGRTHKIPVTLGVQGELMLEVKSDDIKEGDKVVLNPSVEIEDGVQVNEIGQ